MSMGSLSVSAYHGWGFDSSYWDQWRHTFVQHGGIFQTFDRGYFYHPHMPVFKTDDIDDTVYQLTLVHSFGLHLCPIERLKQTDLLVIFSSFSEFHPCLPKSRKRSQLILQHMISQFEIDPHTVLNRFKTNCYAPVTYAPAIWNESEPLNSEPLNSDLFNRDLLLTDLKALNSASLDLLPLHAIPNVIILHGSHDRIVSSSIGRELAQHLSSNSQFIEVEEAGHALPFTHFQSCWSVLQSTISAMDLLNTKTPL